MFASEGTLMGMGKMSSIEVKVTERDNVNYVLKRFKRQCESFGVIREYKKREAYKKPSVRRKEKVEAAEKRRLKELRKLSRRRSKI